MIDVQDEILSGEPKYRITDNAGNILAENVNIEMTTPVQQPGTPLNKALFDKITSRLSLINKYNNPSVTIENSTNNLNINLPLDEYEENQLVKLQIKPSYEEFTNGIFPTSSGEGFVLSDNRAFNGTGITNSGNATELTATIECPISIVPQTFMAKFRLYSESSTAGTVTIYASNNGEEWETLVNSSVSSGTEIITKTFNVNINKAYSYFKIKLSWFLGTSYSFTLYDFDITNGKKANYNASYNTNLSIGTLPSKKIDGVIRANVKYTLCNDEENWLIINDEDGVIL